MVQSGRPRQRCAMNVIKVAKMVAVEEEEVRVGMVIVNSTVVMRWWEVLACRFVRL